MNQSVSRNIPPSNLDDLLDFIASFVRDNYKKSGRQTDGAFLAKQIAESYPEFKYENVGLTRLGDAIEIAERRGLVIRNRAVRHLEVRPGDKPVECANKPIRLPRVRPDIWKSVVFVSRATASYLNRVTGILIPEMLDETHADSELMRGLPVWAKLEPISIQTQKDWIAAFLAEHPLLSGAEAPVNHERWWEVFPQWLHERDPQVAFAWRRYRTQKVVEYLVEWGQRNDVPSDLLFSNRSRGSECIGKQFFG